MTQEEKRIKLAALEGWKFPQGNKANGPFVIKPNGEHLWHDDDPVGVHQALSWKYIPDYFNDLNAVHKLEKTLNDDQAWKQACIIADYKQRPGDLPLFSRSEVLTLIGASPAERAEAIGKVLNLW